MHIEKREFLLNLRLTQVYCEQQMQQSVAPPIALLRSLNPDYEGEKLFYYQANTYPTLSGIVPPLVVEWHQRADPYDANFLTTVFEQQLSSKKSALAVFPNAKCQGKILVFEHDLNIPDGASAVESEGFVDSIDFPPIDTWFYRGCTKEGNWLLFAWVPDDFVANATNAVEVHFLDILHWFEEWLPSEYDSIMQ